ncbi:hypothetical protein K4U46_10970 [Staphylococcus epidermidis]|nr:hypothetical protein [Staphylococcus epidermidis]
MVKIKNKVTLKPKELIKYLLDLEETEFTLYIETEDGYNNLLKPKLKVKNYISYNEKDETFTVEVTEEITEETKIAKLVSVNRSTQNEVNINFNCSIGQLLDRSEYNYYILNDDSTLTLIWKDGELVGNE